jgi:YD repeat-containing protein
LLRYEVEVRLKERQAEGIVLKNMLIAVFVLAVLMCGFSGSAKAQTNCIIYTQFCPACGDPNHGYFNCVTEITILELCEVMTPACPPAAAGNETKSNCPTPSTPTAGSPICLATGNTYIKETDVRIPGLSGGLALTRTWNSIWPSTQAATQVGLFGPNWRSNFEERVFFGTDNYLKYARGDGGFWSFGFNGSSWSPAAPANVSATLTPGTSYWTLTFKNGEQREFDNLSGNLIAIIDRNGNTTQLSYDSVGRLVTVTDPASRHLYFSYGSGSYLVTGVTSDFGISTSYTYDTQGRLTQVTEPDSSTLSFQYDSNSNISAVLDSQGKTLEAHTYDSSGRGLTSSRAGGVEAVTVSYQ